MVSVIIPTYNRARYVTRAVESAIAQDGAPEIIVVDDGSTDDTKTALARFEGRIVYVEQARSGVVAARNLGLALARGPFIAFLDSDDFWFPGKLKLQLECFAVRPDMVLNCTNSISVDDEGRLLSDNFLSSYPGYVHLAALVHSEQITRMAVEPRWSKNGEALLKYGDFRAALFMGNFILTPTVLARKDVITRSGLFDPAMGQAGEDYDFFWRVSEHGPIGLLDLPTVAVRRGGSDHLASARDGMALSNLKTLKKHLDQHPPQRGLDRRLRSRRITESYAWVGLAKFEKGEVGASRPYLLSAMLRGSREARVYLYLLLSLLPRPVTTAFRSSLQYAKAVRLARQSAEERQPGAPVQRV
ncbi:MAG TPA: glycosyltransferase family 2 protein [Alphaproteobacteria bacterium]|nr:glycosyltransferase family 2 protein [Alphaproteobacteria bacterium]